MIETDTFVALSTPHGESAIGSIRCSGELCTQLIEGVFKVKSPAPRKAYYKNYTGLSGEILDSVVFLFFEKDASYTGDSMLEISCHGNPYILQKVLEDLVSRGCRHALPGEFTQTAFLNGKMDLSQAEAVIDLIKARTDLSFKAASDQLRGSLSKRIESMVEALLQVVAEIEAYIDFPEEDLPVENETSPVAKLKSLVETIHALAETAKTGSFLREGVKATIVGEPNVGKSSLLNCLIGESRVIVSDIPGTTRDFVEAFFFVDPYRVRILDTAGIHPTEDPIEQAGIAKTLEQLKESDLVLLTLDGSAPPPCLTETVASFINPENTLIILNKSDLGCSELHKGFYPEISRVTVSALNDEGIVRLKAEMLTLLGNPLVSEQGDVVAISARHHAALLNAANELSSAIGLLLNEEPAELAASHMRLGMDYLEAIVGKIDNERMLDKLFASFCIGK